MIKFAFIVPQIYGSIDGYDAMEIRKLSPEFAEIDLHVICGVPAGSWSIDVLQRYGLKCADNPAAIKRTLQLNGLWPGYER